MKIFAAILAVTASLLWTQAASAQTLSVFGPLGSPVTYYYAPSVAYSPVVATPTVAYYGTAAVAPVTSYYAPVTSYYAPAASYTSYYTPAYTSYYAPSYSTSYYAPAHTSYYAPSYNTSYYAPATSYYAPSTCCGH